MMAVAKRPEAEWQEYWRTLEAQGWLMVKHGEKQRGSSEQGAVPTAGAAT